MCAQILCMISPKLFTMLRYCRVVLVKWVKRSCQMCRFTGTFAFVFFFSGGAQLNCYNCTARLEPVNHLTTTHCFLLDSWDLSYVKAHTPATGWRCWPGSHRLMDRLLAYLMGWLVWQTDTKKAVGFRCGCGIGWNLWKFFTQPKRCVNE